MDTIAINVQEQEKAIKIFFRTWSPNIMNGTLWEIFRLAVLGGLCDDSKLSVEEVACLFDQLMDFVTAVNKLHEANRFPLNPPEGAPHD